MIIQWRPETILNPHDKPNFNGILHVHSLMIMQKLKATLNFCVERCLLIATICSSRELKRAVKGKNKVLGETIIRFDKGFSQHPSVSLGWGHWPNTTFHQSHLNDRQTLLNKSVFLKPHSAADSLKCVPLNRETETDGSKIGNERERKQQTVADAECHRKLREKREKVGHYSYCSGHTAFGLIEIICVLNISKVWAIRWGGVSWYTCTNSKQNVPRVWASAVRGEPHIRINT